MGGVAYEEKETWPNILENVSLAMAFLLVFRWSLNLPKDSQVDSALFPR